jgi:hypothetical protein
VPEPLEPEPGLELEPPAAPLGDAGAGGGAGVVVLGGGVGALVTGVVLAGGGAFTGAGAGARERCRVGVRVWPRERAPAVGCVIAVRAASSATDTDAVDGAARCATAA